MLNRYQDCEISYKRKEFKFNPMKGLNLKGNAQSKITIRGKLDSFTVKTLYEHYDRIAHNLKVYPTVTIYGRDHVLDGQMGGFYHSERNWIEMSDSYNLISTLAHEMRHGFQYIYFPDLFFATTHHSVKAYLDCEIERDARGYELDYCTYNELWEEAEIVGHYEEQVDLFLQNRLTAAEVGCNEDYHRKNPFVGSAVPRNYHWNNQQTYSTGNQRNEKASLSVIGCIAKAFNLLAILSVLFIGLIILYTIFFSDEGIDTSTDVTATDLSSQYVLQQSSVSYLAEQDVLDLTKEELRLARNEIFARHGYVFESAELNTYFSEKAWYIPNPAYTNDLLNAVELANISLIQSYEKRF